MGYVGCYVFDLYCDGQFHGPEKLVPQYTGRTFTDCRRKAEKDGWYINVDKMGKEIGYALCPKCKARKL